ncbi:Outer membrane receptor proteins, mostly Fe transport [Solimonas aquatica]|uniref:Outer membrane receptor proteins, mostly Fe transport n=1 Tax=Solimonas aquatica TaxID=489703 RepID=A0A1H9IL62_9GAMM|nr:TonB-dependent receptor [Solimonas aquatica]SEQ75350.1 Outer membrane receptor proteins, mostly Fe transport [Solimonas aquatica]
MNWRFCAAALLAAPACVVAQAQEAASEAPAVIAVPEPPAAAPAAATEPAQGQIQEVIVTAQKREQSLQDVPISVTAIDGSFMKDTGAADLAKVSVYVPNVRVDSHDIGSPQVFIRGFGTNAFNPSFESSVGLVQDEIYYGRPGYFTESLFDVDRVEVLRGPQGTLFGKNTIAGVYNVSTKNPGPLWEGEAHASYGSDEQQTVEAGVGGMLNDWAGLRVSGLYRHQDGQLYNSYLDRDEEAFYQKAGRIKLRLTPGESLRSDLIVQSSKTSAPFWPYQLYRLDSDTRNYLQSFDARVEDNPYDFRTEFNTAGRIQKGSSTAALNNKWEIGDLAGLHDASGVLILAGSRFHIDQFNELDVSPADIAWLDSHEHHKQLSAEARFSAEADSLFGLGQKVDFVAGGFFYDSRYQLRASINAGADLGSYLLTRDFCELAGVSPTLCGDGNTVSLPGLAILGTLTSPLTRGDNFAFDYTQDTLSLAGFGQMTWYLTEHWAITPGLRLNRERKKVDSSGTRNCTLDSLGVPVCVIATMLSAQNYEASGLSRSEADLSPKFVLQYFGDSGVNLYASYARGFKSGGFNSLSYTGDNLGFEPEKAQTYELGLKSTLLDNTLRFNATLYETKFRNLQVLAFNGVFFDVSNAGAATSRGVEGDLLWMTPWNPLQLMGSFGWLDAKYDHYSGAPAPVRNPQTGALQIGATQDLGGQRIAFAPRATATLTPTLSFSLFELDARVSGDVIYQGDQYTDTDLDPATHVAAYFEYAARLIVSSPQQAWTLTLGGNNLSDKRVLNQVIDATFFPGSYFAQQAAGRQLYAMLSFRF